MRHKPRLKGPRAARVGRGASERPKQQVPTLKELIEQVTPENRYQETPSGSERRKESVDR